ncbi:MAG: hypothetical protein C0511_05640 [Hyphomicrobium sp.]|nr:hypothetical protein [Hyphomicrobium sp.]
MHPFRSRDAAFGVGIIPGCRVAFGGPRRSVRRPWPAPGAGKMLDGGEVDCCVGLAIGVQGAAIV